LQPQYRHGIFSAGEQYEWLEFAMEYPD